MKIKLVQSGGILGLNKEAETDVNWTKEEANNLLSKMATNKEAPAMPDAIDHTLEIEGKEITVDINKATGKYAAVFGELKKNMKIVKR